MSIKTQGFFVLFTMVYTATKLINIPSTTHNKDTYIIAFIFFVLCYFFKTIINIILCQAVSIIATPPTKYYWARCSIVNW
jgi:hypothetical protein